MGSASQEKSFTDAFILPEGVVVNQRESA